jgi:pyruvate/2-oxoglutarate dehydrogenase complex dihydrolipoamide acyltransferase (E2) component
VPDFSGEADEDLAADAATPDSFFAGGAPAEPEGSPAEVPAAEQAPVEEEAPKVTGFSFGKRDPKDKAKRLARVLVSDMTMYNADLHESALAKGTLKQDFEEEIDKSWAEYVEQVGAEMAEGEGQEFWREALNDLLAKGERLF